MKLATKFSLLIGILLVCLFAIGAFTLHQMQSINTLTTDISQNWLPATINAQRFNTLISEFRRYEINHVRETDSAAMALYELKIKDTLDDIQFHKNKYKTVMTLPEEEQTFASIEQFLQQYLLLSAEILQSSRNMEKKEATALLLGSSEEVFNALSAELQKIVMLDVAMGEKASRASDQLFNETIISVTGLLLAALLMTSGLGIYIVHTVLDTLGKDPDELRMLVRKVASGDLNIPQDEDAVGVYADVLIMVDGLKEHIESVETLTENIPGGVLCSLFDEGCSLVYVSDGFVDMFGYTREELKHLFKNMYVQMIVPEDRRPTFELLRTQLAQSNTFEISYQVTHKKGYNVWVLERGRLVFDKKGQGIFYCVLIDITELKNTQAHLKLQEEQCRMALCATHDFVFESDLLYSFTLTKGKAEWEKLYGYIPQNFLAAYEMNLAQCHPDDVPGFCSTFHPDQINRLFEERTEATGMEYRLFNPYTGRYTWYQTTIVPFLGSDGKLDKLFGCTLNIDVRKQQEYKILHSAQSDSLTGLFNKGHVEERLTEFLEGTGEKGVHSLFVIDIDNFKAVNDNLGHLFGDAVLTDVAAILKTVFRSSDIIGRLGGDEFIALLKHTEEQDSLTERKAMELHKALQRTVAGDGVEYTFSGSIGIALFPQDGGTYRALFKKADMALYGAKKKGKNCYCFYHEAMQYINEPLPERLTAIAPRAAYRSFNDDMLAYVFELLYEARDIGSVVNIVLGMTGKHYNVSRAYVFQNSPDDLSCSNTYEWCNEGITPQKDMLQNIAYADMGDYLSQYTHDGVFYCADISKLNAQATRLPVAQNIKSLLHLAIFDEGKIKGYVGFDEYNGSRLWTQDEIASLSILAKILGLFLLKNNISRKLIEAYDNVKTILDSLNIWAYVIDEKTFELLYVNAKTSELSPTAQIGVTCHKAFFNKAQPCSFCPRTGLDDGSGHCTIEIHNSALALWALATASRIPWSDTASKTAVLLCCVDITPYKMA